MLGVKLAAELAGYTLLTWGRNIGEWPGNTDLPQVK